MSNIYEFLLYTLTISLIALFILIIKKIFEDKLPPIWQYGIWGILLIKMIFPISMSHYIFFNLPLWIETIKSQLEFNLSSSYTNPFIALSPTIPFPILQQLPQSISDYLFILYALGCIIFILHHLSTYLALKRNLKYGIKTKIGSFDVIQIDGFESAFVCGFIRPVLVVGNIDDIDEKILLHESYHLKYKDNLQNAIWTIFRCIHWCNPFMQYVFNVIGNDIEALCDYRVLENLKGEERRDYGYILLKMANKKYARSLGTTSISNGGKNIAKRIQTIAHFKKYPKGMEIVSICMVLTLFSPLFVGNTITMEAFDDYSTIDFQIQKSFAMTRLYRPQTVASAIDIYARGILRNNNFLLAQATPLDLQKQYFETLSYEAKDYLTNTYSIINLKRIDETHYHALLGFEKYNRTFVFLPISIERNNGWEIIPTGKMEETDYFFHTWDMMSLFEPEMIWTDDYFEDHLVTHHTKNGTYQIRVTEQHVVDNPYDINAEFSEARLFVEFEYASNTPLENIKNAAMRMDSVNDLNDKIEKVDFINTNGGAYNGETSTHTRLFSNNTNWNGIFSITDVLLSNQDIEGIYVQIQINGEIVDDFMIERSDWQWQNN